MSVETGTFIPGVELRVVGTTFNLTVELGNEQVFVGAGNIMDLTPTLEIAFRALGRALNARVWGEGK